MAEPLPPVETIDDAFARASEANRALRHAPPGETAEEARRRIVERMRQQEAAKHLANGSGNGKAPAAAKRLNGKSNAPAPATEQVNWAQVIGQVAAETELRYERHLEALKKELVDFVAKSGGLNASDITALAEGLVPYLNERLRETVKPLNARLDEIETVVRGMVQSAAGRHE